MIVAAKAASSGRSCVARWDLKGRQGGFLRMSPGPIRCCQDWLDRERSIPIADRYSDEGAARANKRERIMASRRRLSSSSMYGELEAAAAQ